MKLINAETTLETERLLLEPLKRNHGIALYPLLQDQRIYQYIPQEPPASIALLEQRYEKLETRLSPDKSEAWLNWAVYVKERKSYAGYLQATVLANCSAKIAYMFSPLFWGQGYAYEACKHLIPILWKSYSISEMIAEVDTRNLASIQLLERLDFVKVKMQKDADFFKGSSSDEYVYQLKKSALSKA